MRYWQPVGTALYCSLSLLLLLQRDPGLLAVPRGGQASRKAERPRGEGALRHQRLRQGEGETRPCSPSVAQVGARATSGVPVKQEGGGEGVCNCLPILSPCRGLRELE